MIRKILLFLFLLIPILQAKINIFACEPEWKFMAQEICGEYANIFLATTASQNPHYVSPKPSLIAKIRRSDMVLLSGAELESGYLPILLKYGKKEIQKQQRGYFNASNYIKLLEKSNNNRVQGHSHTKGNPHFNLDPRRILIITKEFSKRVAKLDKKNKKVFEQNYLKFEKKMLRKINEWQKKAEYLKGKNIITYHKYWSYLADWLQLNVLSNIEPKPGIPPTIKHLIKLSTKYNDDDIKFILCASFENNNASNWLADKIKVPSLYLDISPRENLFAFFDSLIDTITSL